VNIGAVEGSIGQIGDNITVGIVTGSYTAIGAEAQVIVTQIERALSEVEVAQQGIEEAERRLAAEIQKKLVYYTRLTASDDVDGRNNPYKALLDYKLEDAPFFYGRAEAVRAMLARMQDNRLTVLHSDFGSGKTSLLQAGLASRLLVAGQPCLHCLRRLHRHPDYHRR
jgi:hypothetical protein